MPLLQQDKFLVSRIAMDEGVARDYSDNDFILLSKDDPNVSVFDSLCLLAVFAAVGTTVIACKASVKNAYQCCDSSLTNNIMLPQDESARAELHAIGFVDGHEGQQSLSVKFYMQMSMQEGNDAGKKR